MKRDVTNYDQSIIFDLCSTTLQKYSLVDENLSPTRKQGLKDLLFQLMYALNDEKYLQKFYKYLNDSNIVLGLKFTKKIKPIDNLVLYANTFLSIDNLYNLQNVKFNVEQLSASRIIILNNLKLLAEYPGLQEDLCLKYNKALIDIEPYCNNKIDSMVILGKHYLLDSQPELN